VQIKLTVRYRSKSVLAAKLYDLLLFALSRLSAIGHSDLKMTLRYAQLVLEHKAAVNLIG
jgi:hypothetical protein